jgi:hypothetical protein
VRKRSKGRETVSPGRGENWLAKAAIALSLVYQLAVMSTTKVGATSVASVIVTA